MEPMKDLLKRTTPPMAGNTQPFTVEQLEAFGRGSVERIAIERARNQRKALMKSFDHSGIPPRFQSKTFDGYTANTAESENALTECRKYANRFIAGDHEGRGLLLIGTPGTGKTHLAAAICQQVLQSGKFALFTSMLGAIQSVKEAYRKESLFSEREAIRRFVLPDLLVLDEVGVQHKTPAEQVIITDLINQRYEQMRSTILISNMTIRELTGVVGERVMDRLREVNDVVVCKWPSWRKNHAYAS